jgi:hypothetical protein
MDYDKFKNEYKKYTEWDTSADYFKLDSAFMSNPLKGAASDDVIYFGDYKKSDEVNSPAHYTRGSQEAIDIIEEAIQDAPSVKHGMLQAQVLKYLLRLWLKSNSKQDAEKARWYLDRLINSL